jgi:hypothetical protein
MLDGAKGQWSLETKPGKGAAVTMTNVLQFLRAEPKCPGGGLYSVGAIGEVPKCTLTEKGHRL